MILKNLLVGVILYGSLGVAWDCNTESDLKGYNIYQGIESGSYNKMIDVNNETDGHNDQCPEPYDPFNIMCCDFTIKGLEPGKTYYFTATAYDDSIPPNESAYSNELIHTVSIEKPIPKNIRKK